MRPSALLNFKENKGISTIRSNGKIIARMLKSCKSKNIGNWLASICGMAAIKTANTGVGNPIKEVVCLLSILNFAKRIAENIGINNASDAGEVNISFSIEYRKITLLLR